MRRAVSTVLFRTFPRPLALPSMLLLALICLALPGLCQESLDSSEITREDFARVYQIFEVAWDQLEDKEAKIAAVNEEFDRATLAYFSGRRSQALQSLSQAVGKFGHEDWVAPLRLTLRLSSRTLLWSKEGADPTSIQIEVRQLYPYEGEAAHPTQMMLTSPKGEALHTWSLPAPKGEPLTLTWPNQLKLSEEGIYRFQLVHGDSRLWEVGQLRVTKESFDLARKSLLQRIQEGAHQTEAPSTRTLRERCELLRDEPKTNKTAGFLFDPFELKQQLQKEIGAFEAGEDPFAKVSGDHWRGIKFGGSWIPLRLFVPEAALRGDPESESQGASVPLIIACHGAGGDENMFFEGYGNGVLKALAETHQALVVCPEMTASLAHPRFPEYLIKHFQTRFRVDPHRIYALGHSMGTGPVAAWARLKPDLFAAVSLIAGVGGGRSSLPIPSLSVYGAKDPLSTSPKESSVRPPHETWVSEVHGHTLIVGDKMGDILDWLLARQKNSGDDS